MARSKISPLVVSVVIASLVAACTAASTGAPSGSAGMSLPTAASSGTPSPSPNGSDDRASRLPIVSFPTGSPGPAIVLPPAVLDPVLADAATRSGVPREQLVVVSAESHTWPDGSLGCPQPGQLYIQIVMEGWQATVRAGTTLYDYRGAGTTTFKLCRTLPG